MDGGVIHGVLVLHFAVSLFSNLRKWHWNYGETCAFDYSTVQKECKQISSKFGYCSLEISAKFHRNFGGRSVIFRPRFRRNFAELHESSNTGRKFANLTTKFRLEFVHTETKIQEPNRNIVILKMCRLVFRILMNEWNQQLHSSLNLTCKHDMNETVQVTQVSRKEK